MLFCNTTEKCWRPYFKYIPVILLFREIVQENILLNVFAFFFQLKDTRRELEVLFSQLSREHSELQRNYQMLHEKLRQLTCFSDADAANVNYATLQADYNAARARIRDLEEILQLKNSRDREANEGAKSAVAVPSLLEIQAKFVREKHTMHTQMAIMAKRLEEAKNKHQAVLAELNEARDQNELLEFRILELEESQERERVRVVFFFFFSDLFNSITNWRC